MENTLTLHLPLIPRLRLRSQALHTRELIDVSLCLRRNGCNSLCPGCLPWVLARLHRTDRNRTSGAQRALWTRHSLHREQQFSCPGTSSSSFGRHFFAHHVANANLCEGPNTTARISVTELGSECSTTYIVALFICYRLV